MELTLTPSFEQEAIQEIRARKSAKPARLIFFRLAEFAARQPAGGFWYWIVRTVAVFVVRWVESKNRSIANHIRWFHAATEDLAAQVEITHVPASQKLGAALDGLIKRIEAGIANLAPLMIQVSVNTEFGAAVHRSMLLMLNLKAAAVAMQRAGRLVGAPDEVTERIESATTRMVAVQSRTLGVDSQHDEGDLALAREAFARRKRAGTALARKPSSEPACHV